MNKKFLTILIALLISGAVLAGGFFITNKKEFSSPPPLAVQGESYANQINTIDTDLDGLQDWEEELWDTDPEAKDTDQDGTNDNDEVKSGRNPLIPGPDDELNEETAKASEGGSTSEENLTPSEKIGRDMFANYLALKQEGAAFDEKNIENFVNELIKNTVSDAKYTIYTKNDLKTAPSEDGAAMKTYGNSLGMVLVNNSSQFENELLIFSRFSDTGDRKELAKLAPILASYRKIIGEELLIPVPENAKSLHLNFINSMSFMVKSLENMSAAENDPFIILATLNRHVAGSQNLSDSIEALQAYFSKNNVNFTQNEAGYKFLHGI